VKYKEYNIELENQNQRLTTEIYNLKNGLQLNSNHNSVDSKGDDDAMKDEMLKDNMELSFANK